MLCISVCFRAAPLNAQATWDAILHIDPFPSPYYSDWDVDPNIATLTVINTTSSAQQVRIHFTVVNASNKLVLSATSEPQAIAAGATVIFDNPYDIEGSTRRDDQEDELARRTGRIREGDYTACAVIADLSGFSLAESCVPFTIVYPDPPLLLAPEDGDVVTQADPLFQWTPVQVPVDFQASYVMRVVEVLPGQTPAEALRANIPHYQSLDGQLPSLRYPIDAIPLEHGKQYAWTVQVLDQNGYAAAGNDGRSEIWTFKYDDGSPAPPTATTTTLNLTLLNGADSDTVPFAPSDTTTGLGKICSTWDTTRRIEGIVFPVVTKYAFPQMISAPAALLTRDTLADGRRAWAVVGQGAGKTIIVTGGCLGNATVPRWSGIRSSAGTGEIADWATTDSIAVNDSSTTAFRFGVAIFSLFEEVAGEDALPVVQAFLENREVEVKPGINLYGVIDAKVLTIGSWDVWNLLGRAYDSDENEIELQGYLGMNQTVGARFGVGGNAGVEVIAQQEFLTLRGLLPKKQLSGGGTLQWGIEISFGDSSSTGYRRDRDDLEEPNARGRTAVSFDLVPKLIAILNTKDKVEWTGSLELDLGYDPLAAPGESRFDVDGTLRFVSDKEWQPGKLKGSNFAIGHPEFYLDINEGLFKSLAALPSEGLKALDKLDTDINARGSFIWRGEELATITITAGQKAADPEGRLKQAQVQMRKDSAYLASSELLLKNAQERLSRAIDRNDRELMERTLAEVKKYEKMVADDQRLARRSTGVVNTLEHPDPRRAPAKTTPPRRFVEASLALGNLSLQKLIDMIGSLTGLN